MTKLKRVSLGSVFCIGVGDEFAYCQVVGLEGKHHLHVVCYNVKGPRAALPAPSSLTSDVIILVGKTFDVFFKLGMWTSIGELPVPGDIRYPAYKVSTLRGGVEADVVLDFWEKRQRMMGHDVVRQLNNPTTVSNALFEEVVRAFFSDMPQSDLGKELLSPPPGLSSNEIFGPE